MVLPPLVEEALLQIQAQIAANWNFVKSTLWLAAARRAIEESLSADAGSRGHIAAALRQIADSIEKGNSG